MKDISLLEQTLGITFKNKALLQQAVVHRSYLNEHPDFELGHNERLEFLGDAVLELVVTEYLYNHYENPEGELTNWRASLVNSKSISDVGKALNIDEYLFLSKGESKDAEGKARQFILADAFEAVVGAMYLDQGYEVCKEFLLKHLVVKLPEIIEKQLYRDPKSKFQELAQERLGITPNYKVLEEKGPDHAKHFVVGLFVGAEKVSEGLGTSKQEAQVDAATKGLQAKGW